ncbi:NADAR family protein [Methanosphaera sp. WGK6]|uniref:NADAR family protein n=1 Tax=Methanosphaera sp. WGK6 TaxID=1561964 RepID=UPI00084CD347|nr:NADAR family protein [Methanosphaera sp. WGK6]OED29861.1 hypothetical protein NL43_06120 [Methanosphaera sp. WGK6]
MSDEQKTYIAPPWIKYPTYPEKSNFWRTGTGAEYLIQFNENVNDKDEYYKIFPKAPSFGDKIIADDSLSENTKKLLGDSTKPLFINLWSSTGKPKYNIDFNKNNDYIFMYDQLIKDESTHIHIGTDKYSSAKEIISVIENNFRNKSDKIWEELKYTVYINALYYKIVTDINFTKELIKTGDKGIVFKSDNLEWGVEEENGKFIGKNLFGLAMMEIRDVLNAVYKNYDKIDWDLSGDPYSKERCMCSHMH